MIACESLCYAYPWSIGYGASDDSLSGSDPLLLFGCVCSAVFHAPAITYLTTAARFVITVTR